MLGNFSGRNVGDLAILGNLLADLGRAYPEIEFLVPTLNPALIRRRFGRHRVRPIGIAPWHLSVKLIGLPVLRALNRSELVLVTDNLLSDRSFFNPLHNYLSSIAPLSRLARRRGVPVVIYHGSLGPVRTRHGAAALQAVLEAGPVTILRDRYSQSLVERLQLRTPPIVSGADCAVATEPAPPEHMDRLLRRLGIAAGDEWLGWNVCVYLASWPGAAGPRPQHRFARLMARTLDALVRARGVRPLLVATQKMDRQLTLAVRDAMEDPRAAAFVDATQLDYREAAGVLGRTGLHVGMRTHSLILAAAGGAPVVNVNTYPKSHGFMETVRQTRWEIDLAELEEAGPLVELVAEAWDRRADLRRRLAEEMVRERARARAGVSVVGSLLGLRPRAAEPRARRSGAASAVAPRRSGTWRAR